MLNLLQTTVDKDFYEDEPSIAKNYDGLEYYDALMIAVSDDTLNNHLTQKTPIPKYKHNKILGETSGGMFFKQSMLNNIDFDGFYTSGYIPKGFDRWHDDCELTGYAMMFSYSKDGNGYFKYKVPGSTEIVTLIDESGWMVRGIYLGDTEDTKFWHCVATEGYRITFLLTFTTKDKYNRAVEFLMRV